MTRVKIESTLRDPPLASVLREVFGVQLYQNNARALVLCILSIVNSDWLQQARSVRRVYESQILMVWLRKRESYQTKFTDWIKMWFAWG